VKNKIEEKNFKFEILNCLVSCKFFEIQSVLSTINYSSRSVVFVRRW